MGDAQDQVAFPGQITIGRQSQRHAGVGAMILISPNHIVPPHQKAREQGIANAKRETARARVGEAVQSAQTKARAGLGWIKAHGG